MRLPAPIPFARRVQQQQQSKLVVLADVLDGGVEVLEVRVLHGVFCGHAALRVEDEHVLREEKGRESDGSKDKMIVTTRNVFRDKFYLGLMGSTFLQ